MKIKNISYKIVNGKWKSDRIALEKGRYSYPVLITIIEDINGEKVEIPLSYNQIREMIEKQIYLERYVDEEFLRKEYSYKVRDGLIMNIDIAYKEDIKKIKEWIESIKEVKENGSS